MPKAAYTVNACCWDLQVAASRKKCYHSKYGKCAQWKLFQPCKHLQPAEPAAMNWPHHILLFFLYISCNPSLLFNTFKVTLSGNINSSSDDKYAMLPSGKPVTNWVQLTETSLHCEHTQAAGNKRLVATYKSRVILWQKRG